MNQNLRISIITDIHWGFDKGDKLGSHAPRLMPKYVKAVNEDFRADLMIDMGDRVTNADYETDLDNTNALYQSYNVLAMPILHGCGNHDSKHLGQLPSYSYDKNGIHIVMFNPQVDAWNKEGINITEEELEWLRKDLSETPYPSLIVSHVPLDSFGLSELPETDLKRFFGYPQAEQARYIIETSGKVLLCIAGHRHHDEIKQINGIPYITQQAFTKQMPNSPNTTWGAYGILDILDDRVIYQRKNLNGSLADEQKWTFPRREIHPVPILAVKPPQHDAPRP